MFSGIVVGTGKVNKVIKFEDYNVLEISYPKEFTKNLKKGASVSVNGVCLTSKNKGSKILKFDVIEETLKRTNLRNVCKNDFVNLERSISASTEIGGHLMSGHVHYAAKILEIVNKKGIKDIKISLNEKYSDYVLEKGYIGINGCSITIGKVNKNSFLVHLIPETLEITNLNFIQKNDLVNIEIDQNTIAIVDTVKKTLARKKS
ncbi:MAG: riboflavin synthase subunit alpha [SAR86 cluster bacterium]|jgi:riboflavin synthase|nr:riboflavin synthase [Gammaproteobacteria bacterium]RCL35709.1 MAG: riboflavin synthase subunit alpha [SAR86 cluster bacterium]URQ69445.1 riboflavin synthase subunit alpha [SAR86 cluster bacterium]|tara:strand:- start:3086 stop:3697 length:612 start_codon:yes stop_codon:yes gene_type:complete